MTEPCPVEDSKSNGFIERTTQTLQGQVRTTIAELEARLGVKIATNSPDFSCLTVHEANILNMFEVGNHGRVPYQRLRGRKMQPDLVEFGKAVDYQPLKNLDLGKAEPRWGTGIFHGIKINSGEKAIATKEGIIKV